MINYDVNHRFNLFHSFIRVGSSSNSTQVVILKRHKVVIHTDSTLPPIHVILILYRDRHLYQNLSDCSLAHNRPLVKVLYK